MRQSKKNILIAEALLFFAATAMANLSAQEALKSTEEEYYDFLSLSGIVERPTLGYRTLSDSVWNFSTDTSSDSDANVWKNNNMGTVFTLWQPASASTNKFFSGLKQGIFCKFYGPEWYNSYNTTAPYGQNDGALWQGKGYNSSLTGGVRLEGYGFELTLKPQICFQQNLAFDIMPSPYVSEYGYFWGYSHNVGIDMPQRFGDSSFWTYDWGDSEIRYTWGTLTLGFGTQAVWIGPSWFNPFILSNNAATFPKFDFGIRKTKIVLPWLHLYVGDIEARGIIGYLSESEYFDTDDSNNHNMINLFSLYFTPSFLSNLVVGANKVCLSKWGDDFWKYANPFYDTNSEEDQKASVTVQYKFPSAGLELYAEGAIDDYLQGGMIEGLLRYPFDSGIFSCGLRKSFSINTQKNIYGEFILELTSCEHPQNKGKMHYSFNMHHQITQGYTNLGQAIGTSLGVGGNCQLIDFIVYYPKGKSSLLVYRSNPDDTYSYITLDNHNETYKANFVCEIDSDYYITKNFLLSGGLTYNLIINSQYFTYDEDGEITTTDDSNNFSFRTTFKYQF